MWADKVQMTLFLQGVQVDKCLEPPFYYTLQNCFHKSNNRLSLMSDRP